MPDAPSCLPRPDSPQDNIDDSFLDDQSSSNPLAYAGPRGPALDRGLLQHLTPEGIWGYHKLTDLYRLS